MKKALSLFLLLAVFFITACGRIPDTDTSTIGDTVPVTEPSEPFTAQDRLAANDTYGDSTRSGEVLVRDESVRFRTEDSYRLEPIAVRAAEEMLRGSLMQPDSLHIRDCVVSDCTDDGECTYYNVSFSYSYSVSFDQRIDSGSLYSVGVRKADESSFDASNVISRILKQYSIFQTTEHPLDFDANSEDMVEFVSAAKEVALSHLKNRATGTLLSVRQCSDISGDTSSVWEVLCEGENDFGMRIPDVYTVNLAYENGRIFETDM